MTRKHFEMLAKVINDQLDFGRVHPNDAFTEHNSAACMAIALDFVEELKKENPRFDETRFIKACVK
mgnify:CR=1 FL=1